MIPFHELILFALAAFALAISPGPNMIYLISRTITQGRKAGLISLLGVICGFLFHIVMIAFGLTTILFTIPIAFTILQTLGVTYLFYLAYQAIKPNSKNIFENKTNLKFDNPRKLFRIGFLTNALNPKTAVFYLSFFPQFIKPAYGSIIVQSFQLGITQISISFSINLIVVLTAAKAALFFQRKPTWINIQKWFMASVLATLAIKMVFINAK